MGVPNGHPASRFAGIVSPTPATATASTLSSNPNGIVMINNGPAVVDSGNNRLLIFDSFSSKDWTLTSGDTTLANPPPVAIAVLGQGSSLTNFTTSSANTGNAQASFSSNGTNIATLWDPSAAAVAGTDLFVVDTRNQRVLVYPNAGQAAAATVVLGQSGFPYNSPNSIHGQEFYFGSASAGSGDAGIAVDSSSGTPHLYVSDPNNNRVLGFADARKVGPGVQADIVIGQIRPEYRRSAIMAAWRIRRPRRCRGSPRNPACVIPRAWRSIRAAAISMWPTRRMGACCDSRRPLDPEIRPSKPTWCWAKAHSRESRTRRPASP